MRHQVGHPPGEGAGSGEWGWGGQGPRDSCAPEVAPVRVRGRVKPERHSEPRARRSAAPRCPSQGSGLPLTVVSLRAAAAEVEERRTRVVWCAVGPGEQLKCQQWSNHSAGTVTCATAATTEDCIALVLVGGRPRGSLRPVMRVGRQAP